MSSTGWPLTVSQRATLPRMAFEQEQTRSASVASGLATFGSSTGGSLMARRTASLKPRSSARTRSTLKSIATPPHILFVTPAHRAERASEARQIADREERLRVCAAAASAHLYLFKRDSGTKSTCFGACAGHGALAVDHGPGY
jgi:hypothetical protein